ncbi:hypothetical protein [Carboxylicivirga sp. N1Y90]|uniref:hypothetical protein n=1 Tax=Carboxylicivirga fragile TaxID=3417571 RepID=UPI003D347086|nr:hypothetical protein [Marinilabiliaceae bacterium N1Y90]
MKKYSYIYLLGSLILVTALAKYIFVPTVFPPFYYTFEIVSLLLVLGLTYFAVKNFDTRTGDTECEKQCAQRDKLLGENKELKRKIEALELEKTNTQNYQSKEEQFLSALNQLSISETENVGNAILKLIGDQFELIAGIVYEKNDDSTSFQANSTFGVDDDWKVEPIKQGEGLHGQSIAENIATEISEIPEEYFEANSGTGKAKPAYIYILPYQMENGKAWLIEIASFKKIGIHDMWNKYLESAENKNK